MKPGSHISFIRFPNVLTVISLIAVGAANVLGQVGGLDTWTWRNPLPQGNSLRAIAWGASQFVAVGAEGAIITSPDAIAWSAHSLGASLGLNGVVWGSGQFVAVGGQTGLVSKGVILTSGDGASWTSRPADVSELFGVAWSGAQFVAVGAKGVILTSSDGTSWTRRVSGTSAALRGITWGGGQFVVVGELGTILTSADGVIWMERGSGLTDQFHAVAWGGNRFVLAGSTGVVLTSADGVTWTNRTFDTLSIYGLAWSGTLFAAVGGNSYTGDGRLHTSSDGVSWTGRALAKHILLRAVVSAGQQFVAVGDRGTIQTSTDGVTWTDRVLGFTGNLRDVAVGAGRYVAVSDDCTLLSSSDAVNWTPHDSWALLGLRSVVWNGSRFLAVGRAQAIWTSTDGTTWQEALAANVSADLNAVAWGGGHFVAVGWTTYPRSGGAIYTSDNGTTWVQRTIDAPGIALEDVAWSGSQFVAVGSQGTILTSPDGATWTRRPPVAFGVSAVTWGGDRFVAVGSSNGLLTSADGAEWTPISLNGSDHFYGVAWGGGQFVAVGERGAVLTSSDAVNWISRRSGNENHLQSVMWTGDQFIAVGELGAILTARSLGTAPTITSQPQNQTSAAGANAQFSVAGSSAAPLRYQWQKNGMDIPGATNATLTLNGVTTADVAEYRVWVINGADGVVSQSAALSVQFAAVPVPAPSNDYHLYGGPALYDVVWNGRQFLAVGENGAVSTSPNGIAWARHRLSVNHDLRGVAWSGNFFVVVTEKGLFLTSTNGAHWTARSVDGIEQLQDVTWAQSQFVAVGADKDYLGRPVVVTSPDGVQWTSHVVGEVGATFYSVAWTGEKFIAAGYPNLVGASPNGVTWTLRNLSSSGSFSGAASNGAVHVLAGSNGDGKPGLFTSADAINWTGQGSPSRSFHNVTWGGSQFVAVGENGVISTSADGATWTSRVSGTANFLSGVAWSAALYVAVGGKGAIVTSRDGVNWTSRSSATAESLQAVAAGPDVMVAVGERAIVSSSEGTGWTNRLLDPPIGLTNVVRSESCFVAVGWAGLIMTSADGQTWTTRRSGQSEDLSDVVWNGTQFVAVGGTYAGPARIFTSPDGETWTSRDANSTAFLRAVAWGNNRFVAFGLNSELLTSSDGITWTKQVTTAYVTNLAWSGALFVGVGDYGSVVTSPDGMTWTERILETTGYLNDVVWTGSQFVAVGDSGRVLTSPDGIAWTQQFMGAVYENLEGVAWTGTHIVAVGARGAIFTAKLAGTAPTLLSGPVSAIVEAGTSAQFSVTATGSGVLAYRWRRNGTPIDGATAASFTITAAQLADAGSYDVIVADAQASKLSRTATLGISSTSKVAGNGTEVGPNTPHPSGRTFDQVLVTGAAEAITADWQQDQITRTSFIDLDDDIVQVEFSGPGTLALVLDAYSSPARPVNYNQTVDYVKGHAGIVITGADERTNVSVFTVGRATAFDSTGRFNFLLGISDTNNPANNGSPLFVGHESTVYDGVADIAYIAITSANGKFGGVRTANAHYFAAKGLTGVYAPGIAFEGPIFIGDITAAGAAVPVIVTGSASDVRITGGNLLPDNNQAVEVSGLTRLLFVDGSTSGGEILPAQNNQAVLEEDGVDVTEQIVVNPTP